MITTLWPLLSEIVLCVVANTMISIRARRLNSSGTISPLLIPVLTMMMDEPRDSVVVFVNVRDFF